MKPPLAPTAGEFGRAGADAVSVLTVYLVLLYAIPAPLTVGVLGSMGAPATLFALVLFLVWLWFRIQQRDPVPGGGSTTGGAALFLMLATLVAYAHAMAGPIPVTEVSPADSGLIRIVGLGGLVLLATDGITSHDRLRVLHGRIGIAAVGITWFAVAQILTGSLLIDQIDLPGLSNTTTFTGLSPRAGFLRPTGTATHAIEFGAVLSMMLPLLIMQFKAFPRRRLLLGGAIAIVGFVIMMSISRTALLCSAVGVLMLLPAFGRLARWAIIGSGVAVTVIAWVTIPGLVGTLRGLFTGAAGDSSIVSRTGGIELALDFVARSPLVGRGFGTFLPRYWILDNMYLQMLVEVGLLGLGALLFLLAAGYVAARGSWRASRDQVDRDLAIGVSAGIAAGALGLAFFDGLVFQQSAGTLFLLLGLAGASRRLSRPGGPVPDAEATKVGAP